MVGDPQKRSGDLKKVVHEMGAYLINAGHLAFVFSAFTQYRRLVLAAHDITYTHYWIALIKALILAKVIMLADVFGLGRGFERQPLIFPTLYKTVIYTLFAGLFTVIERGVRGLWLGKAFTGGFVEFFEQSPHELMANFLAVLIAFIPFFAFKELGRVLGGNTLWSLFFSRNKSADK